MKISIVFFLAFTIFGLINLNKITAQNIVNNQGNLKVIITDRITDKPIEGVNISLFKRVCDIMPDGLPSLHPMEESIPIKINFDTNGNGVYETKISLSNTKEYFMLHFDAKGYESTTYSLIVIEIGKETVTYIELIKMNPSSEEQKILIEKEERDWHRIHDEKLLEQMK